MFAAATQAVFGQGPAPARLMLVGEQPGDQEDRQGEPFVGPAGRLLDDALEAAGIDRGDVYLTNAVKHFKFTAGQGKRRLHKKPGSREIAACRPWLEAEFDLVRPTVLVCLGATAAQAILGNQFRITRQRGQWIESPWSRWTLGTYHPSAVLRAPDAQARQALFDALTADLTRAAKKR